MKPPSSEMIVLTRATIPFTSKAFTHSYTNLAERLGIYSAKGLIECSHHDIPLVLANLSSSTRILPKGTLVSSLEFCDENEWIVNSSSDSQNEEFNNITNDNYEKHLMQDFSEKDKIEKDLPNDFSNVNINEDQLRELKKCIKRYSEIFSSNPKGPTPTNAIFHEIDTGENKPVNQPPHRASPAQRCSIEKIVEEMRENKVIKPSKSPWASPVVLVSKKDGSTRFCVDYRKINSLTKKDVYPLPRIDDTLNALGNSKFFSSFDLASGYWQIPMNPKDQEKTAFISHTGLFEFLVMPFGLCNGPATFQRFMDIALAGIKWKSCLVYLDDIIVFSPTFEQHLLDLEEVFTRLKNNKLSLKASKCYFCQKSLVYLGHLISEDGIAPDPEKIRAIIEMPTPKDKTELRSFLGMSGYYRKFVFNYAMYAFSLHELTHRDVDFIWNETHEQIFQELKSFLAKHPILRHPDFDHPFIVQTDACDIGIGAVLCQIIDNEERVVQYISRTLQPEERKWCVREKEALAIIWACQQFKPYLSGSKFLVQTDHHSLQWLKEAKSPPRLVRWALNLTEFDFEIKHKKGSSNGNADCLSRLPTPTRLSEQHTIVDELDKFLYSLETEPINLLPTFSKEFLKENQKNDNFIHRIHNILIGKKCSPEYKHLEKVYIVKDDLVYRKQGNNTSFVLPQTLRETVLKAFHNDNLVCHIGRDKMFKLLKVRYFWPGMHDDIHRWVMACIKCRRKKPYPPRCQGNLIPIKCSYPFEIIGMDIVGPFKTTKNGNRYVLTIIDYFTNWVEAVSLKTISAEAVANAIFSLIITRHGCPSKLLTDQGTQFTSSLIGHLCKKFNIKKLQTSAYHPQSNGKVERFHRFLKNALSLISKPDQTNWDEMLECVLFAHRLTTNRTINETPFFFIIWKRRNPSERLNI